jgi:hypothetical protein
MRQQGGTTTADTRSDDTTETTGTTMSQKAAPGQRGSGHLLHRKLLLLVVVFVLTQGLIRAMVDQNKYADVHTTSMRTTDDAVMSSLDDDMSSSNDVVATTDPPTPAPTTTTTTTSNATTTTTTTSFVAAAPTPCGQTPWSLNCTEWYNNGTWTVLPEPIKWNQTYSAEAMDWQSSKILNASECRRVGTSLQWQSTTHAVWDADRFLNAFGPHQRITIVGDSVTRQHYATFIEALGVDHIRNCTGFGQHYWGPRLPLSCLTTNNVTINVVQDNYGSWDEGVGPYDGGNRGKSYIGTMADQDYFRESNLIVMNFGIWYYEQVPTGIKTNHTPESYIRHMHALADDIALHRQPHQLVVWRESTGPRRYNYEAIKAANLLLRPYMAQRQIPIIYDHSTKYGPTGPVATTVAKLYIDNIHFCEPALQMTWTTILSHMVQDWIAAGRS